ncbi:MAG: TonB-dependent receptor [Paucibacter sp.]|nr:TonB-dependent receptor [Roseateles sp.]
MPSLSKRHLALALAIAYPMVLHAQDLAPSDATSGDSASSDVTSLGTVQINGSRAKLDAARNGLSPETGSSVYRLDAEDLKKLPQGESTPLNQVILQTPGVVQDGFGQIHVRGDHSNIQYRINGVVIPESISGFGQSLQTRFADHLNILTGALPAQYGYRTAAVVDIQSKGEALGSGGSVDLRVGSRGMREFSAEASGTRGPFSYFVTGSYDGSQVGIENPTPASNAIHDQDHQGRGFADLSWLISDDARVSLLLGSSNGRFQIPDLPGQTPAFTLAGSAPKDSAQLDARQQERNNFAVLSYQGNAGTSVDYQVSFFDRTTDVHYRPDVVGDLQYRGIAGEILRRNRANGLQADLSWRIDAAHTVRTGLFLQRENATSLDTAQVFPADADGAQTSTVPLTIVDASGIKGTLWGAYLQDEWKLAKALTLNYGVRYDSTDLLGREAQLSPRLGLVYEPSPGFNVHAGYARYFTPPPTEKIDSTSVQAFAGTTNALPSDANTAVRAERSNYIDLGAGWQPNEQLTLNLDGYYREVSHLQDEGQFGNALIYSAFNYAHGRIYGVDLSASWHDRDVSAYVNLGFTHARARQVETGQFNFDASELAYIAENWVHLDHEQKLSASAGLSWKALGTTWSASALGGTGLRNGYANTQHLPGYGVINAAAARSFGKLEVRVGLDNVFDRTYLLRDGSGIGVGAPQYGLRRTAYLGLSQAF